MKKSVVALAVVSLLAMGTLLVYHEAVAMPLACSIAEEHCDECNGSFWIDYCIPIEHGWACWFYCVDWMSGCPYYDEDPTYWPCQIE
jgi:hypothetical protein